MEPIHLSAEDAAKLSQTGMVEILYSFPIDSSASAGDEDAHNGEPKKFQLGLVQIQDHSSLGTAYVDTEPSIMVEQLNTQGESTLKTLEVPSGTCLVCCNPILESYNLTEEMLPRNALGIMSKTFKISPPNFKEGDIKVLPDRIYCAQCFLFVKSAKEVIDEIEKLEKQLGDVGNLLKSEMVKSKDRHPQGIPDGDDIKVSKVKDRIRNTFLQCWTECQVQLGRNDHSEYTVSVSKRGRPRKLKNIMQWIQKERKAESVSEPVIEDETADPDFEPHETEEAEHGDDTFPESEPVPVESADEGDTDYKPGLRKSKRRKTSLKKEGAVKGKEAARRVPTECSVCRKVFRNKQALEKHEVVHVGEFKCDICHKAFNNAKNFRLHQVIGHQLSSSTTSKPKEKYSPKDARFVLDKSKNLESFECLYCKKTFNRNENCITQEDGRKSYTCPDHCGKNFPKFGVFARHHEKNCPAKPDGDLECEFCGKKCFSQKTLESHKASFHTKDYGFYCETCGVGVPNKWALTRHMLGHTNERNFQCELCQQTFKRKDYLILHMRRHNNDMPYMCGQCGKRFISKQELKLHEDRHENVKQYPCPICQKLFSSKPYVSNHVWATHKKARNSKRKLKPETPGEEDSKVFLKDDRLFQVPAGNYRLFRVCLTRGQIEAGEIDADHQISETELQEYGIIPEPVIETTPEVTDTVTISMEEA